MRGKSEIGQSRMGDVRSSTAGSIHARPLCNRRRHRMADAVPLFVENEVVAQVAREDSRGFKGRGMAMAAEQSGSPTSKPDFANLGLVPPPFVRLSCRSSDRSGAISFGGALSARRVPSVAWDSDRDRFAATRLFVDISVQDGRHTGSRKQAHDHVVKIPPLSVQSPSDLPHVFLAGARLRLRARQPLVARQVRGPP
jgi:hypothetical protein